MGPENSNRRSLELDLLVIEDTDADVDLLRAYLEESTKLEPNVRHAPDLQRGLDAIERDPPELIVLDAFLPDSGGRETLQTVADVADDIPIVAWSGARRAQLEQAALRYGVDEFLPKDALDPASIERRLLRAIDRHEIREALQLTRRAFDAAQEGVVLLEAEDDGVSIVYSNPAFLELTGYSESDLVGASPHFLRCEETDPDDLAELFGALDAREAVETEMLCARKNGERFWNSISVTPLEEAGTGVTHFVSFHRDVTPEIEAEQQLAEKRRQLERYREVVENATDVVFFKDDEGHYQLVNERFEEVFELPRDEIVGSTDFDLFDDQAAETIARRDTAVRESGECIVEEESLEFPTGNRTFLTSTIPYEEDGEAVGTIGIAREITELQQLEQQALYDHLTGLPNRHLFRDRVRYAIERGREADETFAVGLVDLDDFKAVNDSFGHDVGDTVLEQAARRIESAIAASGTVGRLGGDEFTLLLEDVETRAGLRSAAADLEEAFESPFDVEETNVHLSVSIGFALHPGIASLPGDTEMQVDQLIQAADDAMYRAKESPGTSWRLLTPDSNRSFDARIELEHQMRIGLEHEQFEPHYQPLYRLDGEVYAIEMLARWNHPERGLVSPGVFIPVAERTDLLQRITEQLLSRACRDLEHCELPEAWRRPLQLNVNLSPGQVAQPDITERLGEIVGDPEEKKFEIALEITEGQLLERFERVRALAASGFRIVVDDFGTGYSSLSRIKEIPMDELKLDMVFVQGVLNNEGDAAIVRAVAELGEQLGTPVVGEGVETLEELAFLKNAGCAAVQGYLMARPAPLTELLEEERAQTEPRRSEKLGSFESTTH